MKRDGVGLGTLVAHLNCQKHHNSIRKDNFDRAVNSSTQLQLPSWGQDGGLFKGLDALDT